MAVISFKDPSVKANRIAPEIFHAIAVASDVWDTYGCDHLIVTGLCDGAHRVNSLHYIGRAVDLRTHNLAGIAERKNARDLLAGRLGRDFDVLYENPGQANEHIHVEYDPKP